MISIISKQIGIFLSALKQCELRLWWPQIIFYFYVRFFHILNYSNFVWLCSRLCRNHRIKNIFYVNRMHLFYMLIFYFYLCRIGLCGFDNPHRDQKTEDIKKHIGQVIIFYLIKISHADSKFRSPRSYGYPYRTGFEEKRYESFDNLNRSYYLKPETLRKILIWH